jgi:hypothetical protein
MTQRRLKPSRGRPKKATGAGQENGPSAALPEIPYEGKVLPDSVDVTGIVPKGIRIDPDITERRLGYPESGDSEIIPPRE